ncbi:acetyltransferase [Tepidibacter aestuarii]|uniref:acetyltransferase n=1 Tax=Tepidibacter aestuarii TaxID=2925782 RepID=UPI0020BECE76|nr:acetyltransferase [Tepidibacter aestuarii]CAH2211893.1 Sugar O-acyltransferase (Sialic acid O-acetyltransferase NeuD family) [Tepidibacter aestuarii]
MKDIILIGGGGHCKSIIDSLKDSCEFNIVGILDLKENIGGFINNIKIIGTDNDLVKFHKKGINYAFIGVGSIGNPKLRIELYENAKKIGYKFPFIIDKSAIISKNTVIKEGSFIGKGVIINSDVHIGKNCIINTGCIIDHECIIKDFVHIAPGSVLSGGVEIGTNTHIGTNSTIIQYRKIGSNTIIGAGSVVVKDIKNNVKAYGNPCKEVY